MSHQYVTLSFGVDLALDRTVSPHETHNALWRVFHEWMLRLSTGRDSPMLTSVAVGGTLVSIPMQHTSLDEKGRREPAMNTAGLSKTRLGRMHDYMSGYVERGEVPGLMTLVSRRGEVQVDVIGRKAIADPAPMRRHTIFRISSMTKPITAVATMILVEECKLRLDEPVDRWLPE